jgi:histidyl-tRNA synthetase
VAEEIERTAGTSGDQARQLVALADIRGANDAVLKQLNEATVGSERGAQGVQQLADLIAAVSAAGVPAARVEIDPAIARGLDYYTGTVYETILDELPAIGSVASGGRYDNLAELYTHQQLPGVGASLGLDRLLDAMQDLNMIEPVQTPAAVFIPYFEAERLHDYLRLAARVRAAGIGVEVYPEPKKLGKQLQYADRRGFRVALIAGNDEFASGQCQVKHLATGGSTTVPCDEHATAVIAEIAKLIAE